MTITANSKAHGYHEALDDVCLLITYVNELDDTFCKNKGVLTLMHYIEFLKEKATSPNESTMFFERLLQDIKNNSK